MRKLLFLALFLILLQPLFSSVTYPEGLPGEEREFLDMAFFEAVDGRKDVPIMVTGYELGEDRGVLSFSIEGKEFSISVRDRDEMVRFLSNALYAEPLLFHDGDVVDYVYEGISSSLGSYGYGDMFYIKDRDGRVRGVAQGKGDGELTILKTFYEKELKPGLSLSKGPSWALSFSLSSPFLRLSFDASVALRYLSLVRNFYPYVLFDVVYDRGVLKYYGGLGFEVRASLANLFSTDFTMLEDGALYAGVEVLLGYYNGFSWGIGVNAGYEHFPASNFFYRLGYRYNTIVGHQGMLSMGVLF